jgi:hypothetical protein
MDRRRLILTLVVYLVATLAAAPLAFHAGRAKGARIPIVFHAEPTPLVDYAPAAVAPTWNCAQFSGFPGIRQFDRIQDCRPPSGAGASALKRYAALARPSSFKRSGPLSDATVAAIAETVVSPAGGSSGGGPGAKTPPAPLLAEPFSLALAPSGRNASGGGFSPPSIPTSGLPDALIPLGANGAPGQDDGAPDRPDDGFDPVSDPGDEDDPDGGNPFGDPDPLDPSSDPAVVPVPPALPLLLSGLLGLAAISRKGGRRKP